MSYSSFHQVCGHCGLIGKGDKKRWREMRTSPSWMSAQMACGKGNCRSGWGQRERELHIHFTSQMTPQRELQGRSPKSKPRTISYQTQERTLAPAREHQASFISQAIGTQAKRGDIGHKLGVHMASGEQETSCVRSLSLPTLTRPHKSNSLSVWLRKKRGTEGSYRMTQWIIF
jgi:hypothetical protein